MNSTKNDFLSMVEINEGYFLCQDSSDISVWLKKYPETIKVFGTVNEKEMFASPLIVNQAGRIDAYFIFREILGGMPQYILFYIPAFVSKKFNLLALQVRYKNLDIHEFYNAMFDQLQKLTAAIGHPCPVYGYRDDDFVGFFYVPEMFMCQN